LEFRFWILDLRFWILALPFRVKFPGNCQPFIISILSGPASSFLLILAATGVLPAFFTIKFSDMQQFSFTRFLALLLCTFSLFQIFACKDDDGATPSTSYENGIFITNEGPFQNGSGTVTFYDRETGETSQQIFEAANAGKQVGNILQSLHMHNGKAYLVVNNAGKVIVTDARTFVQSGEVSGLGLPRYFLPVSGVKAFISQWGNDGLTGSVAVLNLNTLTIEKTIPTGTAAERMLVHNGKVFVTNTYGFLGRDSSVAVVDIAAEKVEKKIVVGDNPNAIQLDKNGAIWVVCAGHVEDFTNPNNPLNTPGRLVKIVNESVAASYLLPGSGSNLVIDSNKERLFYLVDGAVYDFSISQNSLNAQPFASGYFYALGFDPEEVRLLASDAKDFQSNGEIKVFSLDGTVHHSIPAGIIPGGFWVD
jgi:hypothetical protein